MSSWLLQYTHHDNAWWVAQVQRLIGKYSQPSEDPNHDSTDPIAWLGELTAMVAANLPSGGHYDGNMRMASVLGHVLTLWCVSVHRAKTQDPRRPVSDRMASARLLLEKQHALVDILINTSEDSTFYPGQSFESPWLPVTKTGDFV